MGTIGNRTGLTNETECTQCPGGFYCETAGRSTVTGKCQGGISLFLSTDLKLPRLFSAGNQGE